MVATVSNTIRIARQKKSLTQEELADAVGVTRQTIIALEKGNYIPSLLLALSLSEYFEKSVDELFFMKRTKGTAV